MRYKKDDIKRFQTDIKNISRKKKISYLDAIVLYCNEKNIEVETVANFVNGNFKSLVKKEATELNLIKKKKS